MDLGGDEEDLLIGPRTDVLIGRGQGVDEAAALVADIQGADRAQTQLGLDGTPMPGK